MFMMPKLASHRDSAFSSIASNTGVRSPGELLMTCNTSAVAVCCSRASRVSVIRACVFDRDDRLRREVFEQRDLLFRKRPDLRATGRKHANQQVVFAKRHIEACAHARMLDGC